MDSQHRLLSGDTGSKDIAQYKPALGIVFEALSPNELAECEELAEEWNAADIPDEVLRKWVHRINDLCLC